MGVCEGDNAEVVREGGGGKRIVVGEVGMWGGVGREDGERM